MKNSAVLDTIGEKDIAVIGISGRFPKAGNLEQFWNNLRDGLECVTFFTDEEMIASGVDPELLKDPNYIKANPILEDSELFDAAFFGYTPREAEIMDPQQRFFLELAWEALENAGVVPDTYKGLIGVYGSVAWNTYLLSNLCTHPELFKGGSGFQIFTANDKDYMPTRVAYKFNLKGPSMIVQTACSSSLVATHLAVLSLLNYECDMALVGGSTVKVPQKSGYIYQEGSLASPDGHCRAFDENAHGTVFGSGAGVVVLKRASEAVEDGDHIYAIIKGSAINNDGSLKVSYTAPSVDGQAEVVASAQAVAGVDADTISYIETHGTGTSLGDPIEVSALTKVFRESTDKKGFCAIGSVKTNVGHLDSAAGVAGLLKTVLSLYHKEIPPSLNYEKPNPKIDFETGPFFVNNTLRAWEAQDMPRRAGVSSFGVGGTNAHVILEEAPQLEPPDEGRPCQLLVLSAKTATALDKATENLKEHLKKNPRMNLADAAYTLKTGRSVFRYRRALACKSLEDAVAALEAMSPSRVFTYTDSQEPGDRPVVFMFTGQGSQYVNMGKELYDREPVFRQQVDRCAQILRPYLGLDLRELLYPPVEKAAEAAEKLNQTWITQPALFVMEYSLAKQLMSWGITPKAMIGHSIGEYSAACISGVFTLEEALMLVAKRGRLMQDLPAGSMLSVALPESDARKYLDRGLSLAAVNGPSLCVLSGPSEIVAKVEEELQSQGINAKRLVTSHAFHSGMMDSILEAFKDCFRNIRLKPPEIPYISNVTGTWISDAEAMSPAYWAGHLRGTVNFSGGVEELLREQDGILVEVGPGRTLCTLAKQHLEPGSKKPVINVMRPPNDPDSDLNVLYNALGRLWISGLSIPWDELYKNESRYKIPLPAYPFERQRYWIEPAKLTFGGGIKKKVEKNEDVGEWFYVPTWKQSPPVKPFKHAGAGGEKRWLLWLDGCGIGNQMMQSLKNKGQEVIGVIAGDRFEKIDNETYMVRCELGQDYDALFEALVAQGKIPDVIVHMWSLKEKGESFEETQSTGFYSLLHLTQAIGKLDVPASVGIHTVSNNLFSISDKDVSAPEKATLLGLGLVIPQEYPDIACQCIDIELSGTAEVLADRLLSEIVSGAEQKQVAYRGSKRWIPGYDSLKLEDSGVPAGKIRQNGVYMITGGSSGIGLELAEYLKEEAKANLILVDDDDITDGAKLREIIDTAVQRFGRIDGLIHAAGVSGEKLFSLIQDTGKAECELHFKYKAHALCALDRAFKGMEPDFAIAVSTVASALGGLGYGAYAASNIFMDAFANGNGSNNLNWISVNWDAWKFKDQKDQVTDFSSNLAQLAMNTTEGRRVFERILQLDGVEQVLVSTADLQARLAQWVEKGTAGDAAGDGPESEASRLHERPSLPNPYVAPENELETIIAATWAKAFGFDRVGIYDNFFELGGDSLIAVQVINQLKKQLKKDVPAVSLYQALNIKGMADLLKQDESQAVEERAAQFEEQKDKMQRRRQFQQRKRLSKDERDENDEE